MYKIHIISIGGAAMHNIAIALKNEGHTITGSDDEIYNPSKSKLENAGLLPDKIGWDESNITPDLDFIILGMHARKNNPELKKAQELGIKIYSYPEFIYSISKNKKRVVIGGSQGKTTTTSMIMWVLKKAGLDFDYLVGGSIKGFDLMVKFSNASVIILEGDEYLSSPIDLRPKFHHYYPDIAVITGIDWDHMNVFPTYENYKEQFKIFIDKIMPAGTLIYFEKDKKIVEAIERSENSKNLVLLPYSGIEEDHSLRVFGRHNMENLNAALLVCKELGIEENDFWKYILDFEGATKRLQKIYEDDKTIKFLDFAHAPAKLKATINAVRTQYQDRKLYAIYELHTFSSLNKDFLPQYKDTMNNADKAIVLFNPHTLEMKKMPPLDKNEIKKYFGNEKLEVYNSPEKLKIRIDNLDNDNAVFLFMSSGNFGGIEL
jgi:UDP-N-acetylmuramate: L-alanyl-gamma-D-glutamyl-meso-diaminopimelate ligase